MSQRKMMRQLYKQNPTSPANVIVAYAGAEASGTARRKSDKNRTSSFKYASQLFDDGKKKGWLYK